MDLKELILSYHPCPEPALSAVADCCSVEKWRKGEYMVRKGSMPRKIFFIKSGIVRVGYSADDMEDTPLFGLDGDIWMEMAAWFNDPDGAVFFQECMTDTEAYVLSFEDCSRLMEQYPDWMRWMMLTAFGQLWQLQKKYQWFNSRSAADRYESFISRRRLANLVPVKYIAQYIGVTPSSLSRIRAAISRRPPKTAKPKD